MLLTKLHIPSPGSNIVHRPQLIDRLNSGLEKKLILVSAPADDIFFRDEVNKMGKECKILAYGEKIAL